MKAISLTQPWATLVALGEKQVETRSWYTGYRGLIAIHAAKAYPKWAKELAKREPFYSSLRPGGTYSYPELTLGVVVCVTELLDCVSTESALRDLTAKEYNFGDYSEGRWAFKLAPIVRRFGMEEYPIRGHLGLWNWDNEYRVTSHESPVTDSL